MIGSLKNNKKPLFFIGLFLVVLYMLPYFIFGQNMYIRLNDNLDSEFVWRVLLIRDHVVLNSNAMIPQIMNGLPRYMLPSGLNFQYLFYLFFKPFQAYIFNDFCLRLLAFTGMWMLLSNPFLAKQKNQTIIFAVSLCFALLPFYSCYGLSVLGQPLLLNAFLNIHQNRAPWFSCFVIFLFPFYSNFFLSGFFILVVLLLYCICQWIRNKKFPSRFLGGITLLASGYCMSEYNLIFHFFLKNLPPTQRSVYDLLYLSYPLIDVFRWFREYLLSGQPHAISCHLFILLIVALTLFSVFYRKKYAECKPELKLISVLLLVIFLISLFASFYLWEGFIPFKTYWGPLKTFQLDRFYFLLPLLWFLLFFLMLRIIQITVKKPRFLLLILFLFQLTYQSLSFQNEEVRINLSNIMPRRREQTFNTYFSEKTFSAIDHFIGKPKQSYRVVSIGMDPLIAAYNGFYVLDAYQNLYPLSYKLKFRKIIEKELEKDPNLKNYFDGWGNCCYMLVADNPSKNPRKLGFYRSNLRITKPIENLAIDTRTLRSLGAEYIISSRQIKNHDKMNLFLAKIVEDQNTSSPIYLYKIKETK